MRTDTITGGCAKGNVVPKAASGSGVTILREDILSGTDGGLRRERILHFFADILVATFKYLWYINRKNECLGRYSGVRRV
jgi:hypothetical protein